MLVTFLTAVSLILSGLLLWQWSDRRADRSAGKELVSRNPSDGAVFKQDMVRDLPEPAQRYFHFMIEENTPLYSAVEIEMVGELCLGNAQNPRCSAMTAGQVLAGSDGFVWSVRVGLINGSDALLPDTSWTRFWLCRILPVVRAGGGYDHRRSAFGRAVAESAFWLPASLLPCASVHWEAIDDHSASAVVVCGELRQSVTITVADDGRPVTVVIPRWSNENPEKRFREQPFGGELHDFRRYHGYKVPTRVVGGNHMGTKDYFPFYRATVLSVHYPALSKG